MRRSVDPAPFVVGLDGSQESVHALKWALDEARLRHLRVVAVHAWQPRDTTVAGAAERAVVARAETEAEASALIVDQLRDAGAAIDSSGVEPRPVQGEPGAVLIEQSRGAHALVVASRRKTRLGRLVLGSVSEACVHGAACPVVVVHRQATVGADGGGPWRIVVGVDGSAASDRALAFAAEHGLARRAEVRVVGAVPAPTDERSIAEAGILLRLAAKPYVDPDVALHFVADPKEGSPADVLCAAARHADLLVVGRRGAGGTAEAVGSVSDECVRTAACPVVVVSD